MAKRCRAAPQAAIAYTTRRNIAASEAITASSRTINALPGAHGTTRI